MKQNLNLSNFRNKSTLDQSISNSGKHGDLVDPIMLQELQRHNSNTFNAPKIQSINARSTEFISSSEVTDSRKDDLIYS